MWQLGQAPRKHGTGTPVMVRSGLAGSAARAPERSTSVLTATSTWVTFGPSALRSTKARRRSRSSGPCGRVRTISVGSHTHLAEEAGGHHDGPSGGRLRSACGGGLPLPLRGHHRSEARCRAERAGYEGKSRTQQQQQQQQAQARTRRAPDKRSSANPPQHCVQEGSASSPSPNQLKPAPLRWLARSTGSSVVAWIVRGLRQQLVGEGAAHALCG
eukprot:scaffold100_cov357-Prasinococcus_capsulatus_cf.AAC.23